MLGQDPTPSALLRLDFLKRPKGSMVTTFQPARQINTSAGRDSATLQVTKVGFISSPGLCERILSDLAPNLPEAFKESIDDQISWELYRLTDPLTGAKLEAPDLLAEVEQRAQANGWDYAVCLTDLPVRRRGQYVLADASIGRNIAWISLPALGVVRVRSKAQAAILQLMSELRWGTALHDGERQKEDPDNLLDQDSSDRETRPQRLIGRRTAHQITPSHEEMDIDIRYIAPRVRGHARVLAGMVYANRPWGLFPAFKTAVAAAFATGAYMNVFETVWLLGNTYDTIRQSALTMLAMFILISWVIVSHNLWETGKNNPSTSLTTLYNTATVLTITVAVVFAYAVIFMLLLVTGSVFIPPSMLESTLGHPATPTNYINIAWTTASAATIAGAIGAGLEDTEAVRDATFNWRQHWRFKESERRSDMNDHQAPSGG